MTDRLSGKVAIVTVGAAGIGAAISRLFIDEGASVLVTDDRHEIIDTTLLETMDRNSGRAAFCRIDPREEGDFEAACTMAKARWGELSVAVANAAILHSAPFALAKGEDWDRPMHEQLRPVFLLAKYALPQMANAGGGSFIAVLPAPDRKAGSRNAIALACEGATRSFARSAAVEQVRSGVRVNLIQPGILDFSGISGIARPKDMRMNGIEGTPEDIAWGCVFLASDEAKFISGAELEINGGRS